MSNISYVYIMRLTWWRVKIGYSNAPVLRAKQVSQGVAVKYVAAVIPCRNERKAYALEQFLHSCFSWLRWWGRTERFFMPPYTWAILIALPVLFWKIFIGWWR